MFINLFRRQRPALARLARNSNAYRQPMVAAVPRPQSAYPASPLQPTQPTQTAYPAYPRWMHHRPHPRHPAVGHEPTDRLPHRIRAVDRPNPQRRSETRLDDPAQGQQYGQKQNVDGGVDGQIPAFLVRVLAHDVLVRNKRGHRGDERTHAAQIGANDQIAPLVAEAGKQNRGGTLLMTWLEPTATSSGWPPTSERASS